MKSARIPCVQIHIICSFLWFSFQYTGMAFQQTTPGKTDPEVVEIISTGMNFQSPSEITSGWTTFRYINKTEDTQFFVLEKMPLGKSIEDTRNEVIPVFSQAMDMINSGNADQGFAGFDELPAWFFDVEFTGGPGLVSPGRTAETTLKLEPGTYVIACYVKMPNGQFHSALGMITQIVVTDEVNETSAPVATGEITISSERGIEFEGIVLPGLHTFAVNFEDQTAHEHFLGHDVHLIRIDPGTDLAELNSWMNWADPNGFMTPTPQGVTFLGGTQEMPAGNTSYFHAEISPGEYALISEVPDPESKNMLVRFRVLPKKGKN